MTFGPLINLFLDHQRGDARETRPSLPPHLHEREWRFICECGYSWKATADPVWREAAWRAPVRECVNCHDWREGRLIAPP